MGAASTCQGEDVHLILHCKNGAAECFRFGEGGDEIWQSEVSYYSRAHFNQLSESIDALTRGGSPRYTGADGTRHVQTTMAAICSAKEGLPVRVRSVIDATLHDPDLRQVWLLVDTPNFACLQDLITVQLSEKFSGSPILRRMAQSHLNSRTNRGK